MKNKIKIDSFTVSPMYLSDMPEILKLAVLNQNIFGLTKSSGFSAFSQEITKVLQSNIRFSFVFRGPDDKVIAAFIIKPITSISAEIPLAFSDPAILQTQDMQDAFIKKLNNLPFTQFVAKVYKKRKKLEAYLRYLDFQGFKEKIDENDTHVILCYKK